MNRLTIRDEYDYINDKQGGAFVYGGVNFCGDCYVGEVIDKLAEYEDLEEQGLLLKLPCKVGYTVFCIYSRWTKCSAYNEEKDEYRCQGCECECDSRKEKYISEQKAYSIDWIITNLQAFGKTVFLTYKEAEEKLKELQSK